jgi:5-methyltetrahydropteroyltriglutamate--homocysteine methyltransferase
MALPPFYPAHLLPTTVVGSYPQPDWLVNRQILSKIVPRTRMREIWRIPEKFLEQAQDDATVLAIRDMERAGIDIITDGEIRRESYSNRFATALEGLDLEHPGEVKTRAGAMTPVPRVVGRIRRSRPVELRDMQFLRANTALPAKITLPGPFTLGQQAKNEYYKDDEEMAMDFAAAVNAEALDPQKAGADIITQQISIEAAQPKLDLGVLKDLAREVAFGKLQALAAGAAIVRQEIS